MTIENTSGDTVEIDRARFSIVARLPDPGDAMVDSVLLAMDPEFVLDACRRSRARVELEVNPYRVIGMDLGTVS